MASQNKTPPAATLITPEVILSWPSIFAPRQRMENGKPVEGGKYEAVFLCPKGTDLKALKAAAQAVLLATYPDGLQLVKDGKVKWPFKKVTATDVKDFKYPAGGEYFRASSKNKPGVVDQAVQPVLESERIYPGVHVRASVRPYCYDSNGNKGVTFNLNNLQILSDGPRLDNRKSAEEEFESTVLTAGDDMGLDAALDAALDASTGEGADDPMS